MTEVIQEEKQLTMEDVLEIPEMSDLHQAIRYVQNTPFSKLFPNKYRVTLEYSAKRKVRKLFQKNPTLPLKKVVTKVLNNLYDDDISAELILKMTQLIIQEWTHLSTTTHTEKRVEELV